MWSRRCLHHSRSMSSMSVFNREMKLQQKNNVAWTMEDDNLTYLRDEVATRLVDRLQDIQRDFPLILDLGAGPGSIYKQWLKDLPEETLDLGEEGHFAGAQHLIQADRSEEMIRKQMHSNQVYQEKKNVLPTSYVVLDEEFLPFPSGHFDLVLSCLNLHWVNDLPQALAEIRRTLKPDAVFLGAMLGGETLKELRSCFILAEQERRGGVASHISPMANVADAGMLLQNTGFALPTVDTDIIQVDYTGMFELMEDLKGMGENHAPLGPNQLFTSKETMLAAASIYQSLYGNPDGSIRATFQVIYMIGWSPDASQPQPAPRGSATKSLKELSVERTKAT